MDFRMLMYILLTGVFVNNYVLQKFLGICPFLGVSKKFNQASGMGIAVIFVMLCATAVTWPIQYFVLNPNGIGYLQTIVFILVIAALVQFVEIILKKFIPALHASLGVYLPLITTNCVVLGVAENNVKSADLTFGNAMLTSLGVGIGFLVAMLVFAGVRSRIENAPAPKSFKGIPITLVAAAIVAMAFVAFKSFSF